MGWHFAPQEFTNTHRGGEFDPTVNCLRVGLNPGFGFLHPKVIKIVESQKVTYKTSKVTKIFHKLINKLTKKSSNTHQTNSSTNSSKHSSWTLPKMIRCDHLAAWIGSNLTNVLPGTLGVWLCDRYI